MNTFPVNFEPKCLEALDIPKGMFKAYNAKWVTKSAILSPFKINSQKIQMNINGLTYVIWRLPFIEDNIDEDNQKVFITFCDGKNTDVITGDYYEYVKPLNTIFLQLNEDTYEGVWGKFNTLKVGKREIYYGDRDTPNSVYLNIDGDIELGKKFNSVRVFHLNKVALCKFLSLTLVSSFLETFCNKQLYNQSDEFTDCKGLLYYINIYDYFNLPSDVLQDNTSENKHPMELFRRIKGSLQRIYSVRNYVVSMRNMKELYTQDDLNILLRGLRIMVNDCTTCMIVISTAHPEFYFDIKIKIPLVVLNVINRADIQDVYLNMEDYLDKLPKELWEEAKTINNIKINTINKLDEEDKFYKLLEKLLDNKNYLEQVIFNELIEQNMNLVFRIKFSKLPELLKNKRMRKSMISYIASYLFEVIYIDF